MRNRRAATRFTIRRMARKGQITREHAKFVLSDDDVTDLVAEFVEEGLGEDEDEDGPVIAFIKWLIANQDAVAAFIAMLISLFEVEEE